jgi:hypothetical protein
MRGMKRRDNLFRVCCTLPDDVQFAYDMAQGQAARALCKISEELGSVCGLMKYNT